MSSNSSRPSSARGLNRNGNSPFKLMLQSVGFKDTSNIFLKEWLKKNCTRYIVENEIVTVILEDKIIQAKTVAEACWIMRTKYSVKY